MRIAVLVLCTVGAVASGVLGLKWVRDAEKAKELVKLAEELGVANDAVAEAKRVQTAGYLLVLSALGSVGAGVAVQMRRERIGGVVLLAAALLPAIFAAKAIFFTLFLLVAGGLCFALKRGPKAAGARVLREVT